MILTLTRVLGESWALFRREHDLTLRIVAPFLFLPIFAAQLYVAPVPPLPATRDEAAIRAWLTAFGTWANANVWWYVGVALIALVGLGTLLALLVDRRRPDVRGALRIALVLLPRYVLATMLASIPVGLGLWVLVLPGLYLQARLLAVDPVLFAERPISAAGALARSWRITRHGQFALFGTTVTLFLLQWLAATPLVPLETWLRAPTHANPVATAVVAALLAAAETAYRLALLLAGVVAWRTLANRGT